VVGGEKERERGKEGKVVKFCPFFNEKQTVRKETKEISPVHHPAATDYHWN